MAAAAKKVDRLFLEHNCESANEENVSFGSAMEENKQE